MSLPNYLASFPLPGVDVPANLDQSSRFGPRGGTRRRHSGGGVGEYYDDDDDEYLGYLIFHGSSRISHISLLGATKPISIYTYVLLPQTPAPYSVETGLVGELPDPREPIKRGGLFGWFGCIKAFAWGKIPHQMT